jgi:hypothetical protein
MPFKGTQQKISESGCHPARRQPPLSGGQPQLHRGRAGSAGRAPRGLLKNLIHALNFFVRLTGDSSIQS